MEPRTLTVRLPPSPSFPDGAEREILATEYEAKNKKSIEMFGAPLKLTPESARILVDEVNPPDNVEPTSAEKALMGVQAFGEGAMQGVTLGANDRLRGLAKGTAAAVRGEPFLPAYRAGEETARENREFAVDNAGMRIGPFSVPQLAGNIVGSMALAPLAKAGAARTAGLAAPLAFLKPAADASLKVRALAAAPVAAVQSGITSALAAPSTGTFLDTLLEGGLGALIGSGFAMLRPAAAGAATATAGAVKKTAVGAAQGVKNIGAQMGQALRGEAALTPESQAIVDALVDLVPGGKVTKAVAKRLAASPAAPVAPPPSVPDWLAPSNLDIDSAVPRVAPKVEPAFSRELAALLEPAPVKASTLNWSPPPPRQAIGLDDILPPRQAIGLDDILQRGSPAPVLPKIAELIDAAKPKPVAPVAAPPPTPAVPTPAATPAPVAAPKGRTPEARSAAARKAADTRARNRAKALEELAKQQGAAPAEAKAAAAQVVAAAPDAPAPAAKGKPVPDDVEALQALLASPGEAPMPLAPRPKPAETVVRAKRGQAAPAPAAAPKDDALTLLAQERAAPKSRVVAPDEEGALAELQKRRALSEMAAGGLQEPSPIVQDPTLLAPKRVSSKPRAKVLRPELETTAEEKELSELQRQVMKDAREKFGERAKALQEQFGKLDGNDAALAERDDIIDEVIQEALRNNDRLAGFISPPQRRIFEAIKSGAADVQDIQDATSFTKRAIDQELSYLRRFGFITKDEAEKFAMRRADVGVKP